LPEQQKNAGQDNAEVAEEIKPIGSDIAAPPRARRRLWIDQAALASTAKAIGDSGQGSGCDIKPSLDVSAGSPAPPAAPWYSWTDRAQPVFRLIGSGNPALPDGLDVDEHVANALSRGREAKEFLPCDAAIRGDQHLPDVESHARNREGVGCSNSAHVMRQRHWSGKLPGQSGQAGPTHRPVVVL
jgi:hypothetical protein